MAADGYDAVIRHGPIRDNRLIAKHLASSRRVLVASPAYLESHGTPGSLAELEDACAILYANREADWRFKSPKGESVVRPRAQLRVNNGLVMRDAALADLGITLLPTFFVHKELANGTLRHVDVGAEAGSAELYIAYPPNRSSSAKLISLTECMRTKFGGPGYWEASAGHADATLGH